MNKAYRQGQILKLIRTRNLHTQEELAQALKEAEAALKLDPNYEQVKKLREDIVQKIQDQKKK